MVFILPELPFAKDELAPHISEKTLEFHYGKHHRTYVDTLNKLVAGTELEHKTLEEIIVDTSHDVMRSAIFNNAAQTWNHTFYWASLMPEGGDAVLPAEGAFKDAVINTFGSFDALKAELKQAALGQFGSGWVWLVVENDTLKVTKTGNADTPLAHGQTPLLTIDVWEHAYYLDYQNRRADYVQGVLDTLVNWPFASGNFTLSA